MDTGCDAFPDPEERGRYERQCFEHLRLAKLVHSNSEAPTNAFVKNADSLSTSLAGSKNSSQEMLKIPDSVKLIIPPHTPFEDLKISTKTIMVYTNLVFDRQMLFDELDVTPINVTYTKKKKNVERKSLKANAGQIINIQKGDEWRGVNVRKSKKFWCAKTCRLTKVKDTKEHRINTIIREPFELAQTPKGTVYTTRYYCTHCKTYYNLNELEKIPYFLNQLTIVLSVGNYNLNIMVFKKSFKIAGCKNDEDAKIATKILWRDFIEPLNAYTLTEDSPTYSSEPLVPKFVFKRAMMNVDFKLNFPIDRDRLNHLMNEEKYKRIVHLSGYESTAHSSVNIKLFKAKPADYNYECLVMAVGEPPRLELIGKINPYKSRKPKKPKKENEKRARKDEPKYTTFIVFSSSKIILSGKYMECMKEAYTFFIMETHQNKTLIEERIEAPKVDFLTYIKKGIGESAV